VASYAGYYAGIPKELFIPPTWNMSLSLGKGLPFSRYCSETRSDILEKRHKNFTKITPLGTYALTVVTAVAMTPLFFHGKESENIG